MNIYLFIELYTQSGQSPCKFLLASCLQNPDIVGAKSQDPGQPAQIKLFRLVEVCVVLMWHITGYSKTCVRQLSLKLTLVVDLERWLYYKGTCHVILLAKLHDMYLYKTDNFFHINNFLKSVSKVALLHRFYCNP